MTTGPALVLLHAFASSGQGYAEVVRRLPADLTPLAPDLPGFAGAADLPAPSVAAYADWVEDRIAGAGLARVTLAGWSMGGKIALALAARRPAWLERLALVAPSPPSPEPMDEAERRRQLEGRGDAALAERSIRKLVAGEPPPERLQAALRDRLAVSADAWRWWLQSGSREDLDLGNGLLLTPALVVVGTQDEDLGEQVQRRLTLPRLAHPRLERLNGCGHLLPLEAPGRLARLLFDWATA